MVGWETHGDGGTRWLDGEPDSCMGTRVTKVLAGSFSNQSSAKSFFDDGWILITFLGHL